MNSEAKAHSSRPLLWIFALGLSLRLGLVLLNREANDDHMEVISWIADKGLFPLKDSCWQCYQPKLYHAVCAWIIQFLGQFLGIDSPSGRILVAQGLSALAGAGTLGVALRLLKSLKTDSTTALFAFALLALNPKLIGINAQATNDSFIIFFSSLSIYALYRFLSEGKWKHGGLLITSTLLALLTKGSGLMMFGCVLLGLGIGAWLRHSPSRAILCALGLLMSAILLVPFTTPYVQHYKQTGSPLAINVPKDPPPKFFEEQFVNRPGVTSIAQAYFTFRFFNLLEHPVLTQGNEWFPRHRTSLWTQLYARSHFVHFDQWPRSWQNTDSLILNLGRFIFILALLPTALCIWGMGSLGKEIFLRKQKSQKHPKATADWIFLLFAFAFTAMILKLTYDYRCFCTMKAIYLYPAILCAVVFFERGYTAVQKWDFMKKGRDKILHLSLTLLVLFYGMDVLILMQQL